MRSWVPDRTALVRGELGIAGPVEPPPGEGGQGDLVLHVEELSGTGVAGRRGKRWEAIASVSVHDAEEARVDDVTVTVSWSTGQTGSCETVGGSCSVSLGLRGKVSSVNFSVDNLETTGSLRRQCRPRERTSLDLAAVRTGSARTHRGSPRGISRGDEAKDPIVSAI